jgi:thiamin-phosphate kinase
MMSILPTGKLPLHLLQQLLPQEHCDSRLIVGPRIGEDAAVIDFGETCLVAKTDPITFATDEIGWYVVCVNSNDIATMGAIPRWLLTTILLPENAATEEMIRRLMQQIQDACARFNITLCGGHTEVTYGLERPIVIGSMLGEVEKSCLVTTSGAKPGDALLLTKGPGIEATSIIARERESELRGKFPADFLERARNFLRSPGISVIKEARIAVEVGGVHAMHDPTEGGVATAIHELARAAQVGAVIWPEKLPIAEETARLCCEYQLDVLGVISSGALLIAADPEKSGEIVDAIIEQGISCQVIGRLLAPEEGVWMEQDGVARSLPLFEADEITKIFQ